MVEEERKRIAHELLREVRRLDKERKASKARLNVAVEAAGTTVTDIYGVGPAGWHTPSTAMEPTFCSRQGDRTQIR